MKPYKHVGIHLQLYGSDNHRNHRFSYPTNGNSDAIDVEENFIFSTWFRDSKTLHKCKHYAERLDFVKSELQEVYLDDFYANRTFVGDYRNVRRRG